MLLTFYRMCCWHCTALVGGDFPKQPEPKSSAGPVSSVQPGKINMLMMMIDVLHMSFGISPSVECESEPRSQGGEHENSRVDPGQSQLLQTISTGPGTALAVSRVAISRSSGTTTRMMLFTAPWQWSKFQRRVSEYLRLPCSAAQLI